MGTLESQTKSAANPFKMDITEADKATMENYVPKPRKYKLGGLSGAQITRIVKYKEKYGQYLQLHNNSKQKEVVKMYDYITDKLLAECMDDVLEKVVTKDIEGYLLEQIIVDEFQLQ